MQDEATFGALVRSLERNGDRTRSTLYFLVVLFSVGAMFIVNTAFFKFPDYRLYVSVKNFHTLLLHPEEYCKLSVNPLNVNDFDALYGSDPTLPRPLFSPPLHFDFAAGPKDDPCDPTPPSDEVRKFRLELWARAIERLNEERARERTFTLPLIGLTFDFLQVWILNAAIGLIGLFVLDVLFVNELEIVQHLVNRNRSNPERLRIVLAMQVFGDPGPAAANGRGDAPYGFAAAGPPLSLGRWHSPIRLALLLPVLISFVIALSDLDLLPLGRLAEIYLLTGQNVFPTASQIKDDLLQSWATYPVLTTVALITEIGGGWLQYRLWRQALARMDELLACNRSARTTLEALEKDAAYVPPV